MRFRRANRDSAGDVGGDPRGGEGDDFDASSLVGGEAGVGLEGGDGGGNGGNGGGISPNLGTTNVAAVGSGTEAAKKPARSSTTHDTGILSMFGATD